MNGLTQPKILEANKLNAHPKNVDISFLPKYIT